MCDAKVVGKVADRKAMQDKALELLQQPVTAKKQIQSSILQAQPSLGWDPPVSKAIGEIWW